MKAIDTASKTTSHIAKIKAAGVNVVNRYVGSALSWKTISKAEADALRKAGRGIGLFYETSQKMMLGSNPTADGKKGATAARAGVLRCGLSMTRPNGKPLVIYFACDTAAGNTKNGKINDYLRGAGTVIGKEHVGIYGSYDVCDSALKVGAAAKAFQTRGWSDGKHLTSASVYQSENHSSKYGALGFTYDVDDVLDADFGQWTDAPPVVPAPAMRPYPGHVIRKGSKAAADVKWIQEQLNRHGYKVVDPKGTFGKGTAAASSAFRKKQGPGPWQIGSGVGRETWKRLGQ